MAFNYDKYLKYPRKKPDGNLSHIKNREAFDQVHDFEGLRWKNIRPTDIDVFFEVADKVYVIGEIKHGDSDLPTGQRIALERLSRRLMDSGCKVLCLVLSHTEENTGDVSKYRVRERMYLRKGRPHWIKMGRHRKAYDYITHWLSRWEVI